MSGLVRFGLTKQLLKQSAFVGFHSHKASLRLLYAAINFAEAIGYRNLAIGYRNLLFGIGNIELGIGNV